jgi:hypothetical protein
VIPLIDSRFARTFFSIPVTAAMQAGDGILVTLEQENKSSIGVLMRCDAHHRQIDDELVMIRSCSDAPHSAASAEARLALLPSRRRSQQGNQSLFLGGGR